MRKPIYFEPIPNRTKGSYIALSIRPPRTWFENEDFKVFVGGRVVDSAETLEEAKITLLKKALATCDALIEDYKAGLRHYERERQLLAARGLKRIRGAE